MRKATPPVAWEATTVPMARPAELISGADGPAPARGVVAQAVMHRAGMRQTSLFIGFDLHEHLSLGDLYASARVEFRYNSVERSGERMLHLHRFEGEEALALADLFALLDLHRGDLAGHRRFDLAIVEAVCGAGAARA